jgi:hypothetical protein
VNLNNTTSTSTSTMDRNSPPPALAPGTFSSVLPTVEDMLGLVYRLSEGEGANDEIVQKVGPSSVLPSSFHPLHSSTSSEV